MSARHAHYFSCDSCGHAESPKGNTPDEARNAAEKAGWRNLHVIQEDMCPDCQRVRRDNHKGPGRPADPPPRPSEILATSPEQVDAAVAYEDAQFDEPDTEEIAVMKGDIMGFAELPDLFSSARRLGLLS